MSHDAVLQWTRSLAHDIGFVVIIMRSYTNTGVRGRTSFLLIACERSGEYRLKKHNLVRTFTDSKKCGCLFKLRAKPVSGGDGWMVKLICGIHNHEMTNSLVGHPYACRQTKDELTNSCNLVFLISSTYKTNRYKLSLLDIVGVTPIGMTFSVGFAYLEGEQRFWGLFMRADALPGIIVTDRDLSLMNAVKTVFSDATKLLYRFHIDKNVKAKCKTLVVQKNAWDYMMEVESAYWSLKRLLQNSIGDICSVCEAMNNMMTLQHTQIKVSFDTSAHVVGHVFKVTLYKKLLGMVSSYTLDEIAAEYERVAYAGKNPSRCGYVMRSTHGYLDISASEGSLSETSSLSENQGLSETHVTITREMETISKRFQQLDVCGKIHLKSKLPRVFQKKPFAQQQKSTKRDLSYWEYVDALHSMQNSNSSVKRSASPSQDPIHRRNIPMLNQFHPCIQNSIENIINVKADGNYGYRGKAALLGMGEELWSLVRNHLHKELTNWSDQYMNLIGGIEKFEELRRFLLVDDLSKVTMDKWMNITDMGYVIVSQYNAKQWLTPYIVRMQRYTTLSRLNIEFVDLGES
ncbi:hypothetical protein HKD37_09G025808 [Glycine soja]